MTLVVLFQIIFEFMLLLCGKQIPNLNFSISKGQRAQITVLSKTKRSNFDQANYLIHVEAVGQKVFLLTVRISPPQSPTYPKVGQQSWLQFSPIITTIHSLPLQVANFKPICNWSIQSGIDNKYLPCLSSYIKFLKYGHK